MNPLFYAYGFIFLLLLIINIAARIYDSKQTHKKVESPHIVQRIGYNMMFVPTVVVGLMVLIGMMLKDTEMTIVSSFFTLIFLRCFISFGENPEGFTEKRMNISF